MAVRDHVAVGNWPLAERVAIPTDETVSAQEFKECFDEEIEQTLDLRTWRVGKDLSAEYTRIEREVCEASRWETARQTAIRKHIFPQLTIPSLKNSGYHEADLKVVADIHKGLLFSGGVEACDGAIQVHDTLALTIYQIGVSLVSYRGEQNSWGQRLFRRDLRRKGLDLDDLMDLLDRRAQRGMADRASSNELMGELIRKAMLDYAERAILLYRSQAVWRMGHGNPITYELLTGGHNLELMVTATAVLRGLIEDHQKFVFVASEPRDRFLLTIGQALRPMEYAVVGTLDERLERWLHQERFKVGLSGKLSWDGEHITAAEWIPRLIQRVASQVVIGLFRATQLSPPQVFYAHVDHSEMAAHVALADSVLQEDRGSPLLCNMARHVCAAVFGESLEGLAANAYTAASMPGRYFTT